MKDQLRDMIQALILFGFVVLAAFCLLILEPQKLARMYRRED